MEAEEARAKLQKQRELRRRKILANANTRMDKLLNKSNAPADALPTSRVVLPAKPEEPRGPEDPPDELIPRGAMPVQTSLLCRLVAAVRSDTAVRTRAVAAVACGLLLTVLGVRAVSYVLCMLLLDGAVFVWLAVRRPGSGVALGWLAMLKLPLSLVHSALPVCFERTCLAVLLVYSVITDILLMLFTVIVTTALLSLIKTF